MAFIQTVLTDDGLLIEDAYWIPRILSFDGAKFSASIEFNAYASAEAKANGKSPLNTPAQKLEIQGSDFLQIAATPITTAWADGNVPSSATFFDVIARLAYIVGGARMLYFKNAVSDSGFRTPFTGFDPQVGE